MPKEIFETNSRNGIDDAGYKLQRLLQRNEQSLELDSHKAILPDRDIQANSCLATLHKLDFERPQCLLIRSTADCNDVFANRSPERERTLADHQMTSAVTQFEPKQTVSGERRNGAQAASEGGAKMVVIKRDRGN